MLPQLDLSNFLSQAFWLAVFFSILYIFIKSKFIPNIENIFNKRSHELSLILEEVNANNKKSKELIDQALEIEKETRLNISKLEDSLIGKIKSDNDAELKKISKDLSRDYEKIKNQYEEEFINLSKEINMISQPIFDIFSKKIGN
jgi:F0F1-type ATP synthase membrane subunit b/b'